MTRVAILIPAYNAAHTLGDVIARIPGDLRDLVIVADDGSEDDTSVVAEQLGASVVRHDINMGYGAAQQTLYERAIDAGADVSVMIHSDGGHWPEDIPSVIEPILAGAADVVTGSRLLGILGERARFGLGTLAAGARSPMPLYKVLGHVALTKLQNACYGTNYHSFHDGMRACSNLAVERVRFRELDSWYRFDTEFLVAAHRAGLRIREVGIRSSYRREAQSGLPSLRYGLKVVSAALRARRARRSRVSMRGIEPARSGPEASGRGADTR